MTDQTIEQDKQQLIFAATLAVISERGFHDSPVSVIAKRSGVSPGTIYHYFENKDDLIHALFWKIETAFAAALMAGDPQAEPWPDHLEHIWLNAFAFYVAHPEETLFLEQYKNSPYQKDAFILPDSDEIHRLMALIEADQQNGVMQRLPIEVLHELTLGVAVRLAKRQIAGAIDLDQSELANIARSCVRAVAVG
ncbi:MAG: TetR/AcrR family transcriptional regulator [Chloroflexi bacterium]|nr:TetR/AcrR family transcriptional regulator [Chloroflexota bacterium]